MSQTGIPRIIHQTWHSSIDTVPKEKGDPYSWIELNPSWDYKFWSDETLRQFIQDKFPELLVTYDSYPNPVQRADLGRYCLLYHFGGIYTDIDTTCLQPLDVISGDPRVILCEEPMAHWSHALERGLERLLFNGTMASPAKHPFWKEVIRLCVLMSSNAHRDVLESTGPLIVTAAVEYWQDPDSISINSSSLFCPQDDQGEDKSGSTHGTYGDQRISIHHWQGSWYGIRTQSFWQRKKGRLRQLKHFLQTSLEYKNNQPSANIDSAQLNSSLPDPESRPDVAIFIPVKDGAEFLHNCISLIDKLDYPKDKLSVVFGESNSSDNSVKIIEDICQHYQDHFKEVKHLALKSGHNIARRKRWKPAFQKRRRSAIAKVRNEMLNTALQPTDEWVLWLDVDVCQFDSDILTQLLVEQEKVVVPNCLLESGGNSYDMNSFLEIGQPSRAQYYKHCRNGLFQPPVDYWYRRHLHELRYLKRVPIHGVGGCMLLVHADVHRAGLLFPEAPYQDLLETEAFGYLARDMGITPIALPQLEILHVNS